MSSCFSHILRMVLSKVVINLNGCYWFGQRKADGTMIQKVILRSAGVLFYAETVGVLVAEIYKDYSAIPRILAEGSSLFKMGYICMVMQDEIL